MEAISTKKLTKAFSGNVRAVDELDLKVDSGQIFGFLGPNGAGKTTTMRMLATLLPIDEGEAMVAGYDVRKKPGEVRKHIGYVSQMGGADDEATGFEDLVLQARLYGMSATEARNRAEELSVVFKLEEFINRKIKTYSGGQKRRLDIASGVIHKPVVLFLDEPTTGLDPQNRSNLWDLVRKLRDEGTTVFLTTHYLEEADALSDTLAIMDRGKLVALGTPRDLKKEINGDSIAITMKQEKQNMDQVRDHLAGLDFIRELRIEGETLRLYVADGSTALPKVFEVLEAQQIDVETVVLAQPSLDDVFLKKTGRSLRDGANGGTAS